MARRKWEIVNDNGVDVRYYDAKRYKVDYDPIGNAHFSKRQSGRSKAQRAYKSLAFYRHGLASLIILVVLVRFVFMREYGFTDAFFKTYPNGVDAYGNSVDLYYFDVFGWLKYFGNSVGAYKNTFVNIFDSLDSAFVYDDVSNFFNVFVFIINFVMAFVKCLLLIPLSIIGLIVGGPVAEWSSPDGWITSVLAFNVPYVRIEEVDLDINNIWTWLLKYFNEWNVL